MGLSYLWDTNAVIYYLQENFLKDKQVLMHDIINKSQPAISSITQIELLSWKANTENDMVVLNNFISDCIIFELENDIKFKTVEIRKEYRIKLPDAIIAATAITNGLTLISNDNRGFKNLSSLKLFNPFN